jgi:hypothetical protein
MIFPECHPALAFYLRLILRVTPERMLFRETGFHPGSSPRRLFPDHAQFVTIFC